MNGVRPVESLFDSTMGQLTVAAINRVSADQALAEYTSSLGFDLFSYALAPLPGKTQAAGLIASNYSRAWVDHYHSAKYQHEDPIIVTSRRARLPFQWGDRSFMAPLPQSSRQVMVEANDHGIREGITVPVHGPDGECGLFTGVHSVKDSGDAEERAIRLKWMVALAPYVHAHGMSQIENDDMATDIDLTEHERGCLAWTLEGKTSWEIASIQGRSKATIEYHMQRAIRKLGCSNKTHAAVTALRRGLL